VSGVQIQAGECLAGERVAIAVQAGRCHGDQVVAVADPPRSQHRVAFDDAHSETGEVELRGGKQAGMLSGLASDQRAAGSHAAVGDAGHDLLERRNIQRADRDVIVEHERLGSAGHQIIDHHGHQVLPDRAEAPQLACDLELGAHPVAARDQ
jgi:hypothetical protein